MAEPPNERVRDALPRNSETTAPVHPVRRAPLPVNFADGSAHSGPKKETARLNTLPGLAAPTIGRLGPILGATSNGLGAFDSLPGWFCWSLFGISALIFLSQIWNYALS
ncbi:MAG: hypothetical protein DMF06_00865 [Verrucomicrobia bacterium]|nr:MAG: hypothetical protein DMF06_00865 [Verrucomicrobiota bacterium]